MAGKVVHFEIPVDDPDRGIAFYSQVFGWKLEGFGGADYWTTEAGTGEGIGGALAKRSETMRSPVFYIAVDDIDAALASIEASGGKRLTDGTPIPGVGYSAWFEDSEGNTLGIFQEDASATM